MPLIRITSHHFVAGLVAQHGMVVEAAPIVKYMLGWNGAQVARYCRSKGWTWERVRTPMTEEDKKLAKILELKKFDDDGNEVAVSEEEMARVLLRLREILRGAGTVEFADGALESLAQKGMSEDEVTAMLANAVKAKH